ncbi:MAG: trypsin-like peptidase domain-containing protein [Dehalococcoidia bacterium]
MSGKNWATTLIQAAVVVVAMVAGGVLAVNFAGVGDPVTQTLVTDAPAQSLPVARTAADSTSAGGAQPPAAPVPGGGVPSLADIVADVRRSVVAITVATTETSQTRFGSREFRSEAEGTGIIVDTDGHILTNYHVIEGAEEVAVTLWDGTAVRAQILGTDPANDLAVLRASIQPQRLVPARFGDSDLVRPGEDVFAIGNPFSFDFTVTRGIVSGIDRESSLNSSGRSIRGVIQIDAAVNPGNSGGPLFNSSGEVIGINTAIHNPTQQRVFVGVGLAIPINTALRFLPDLIARREITHPQLGISGLTLSALNAADAGVEIERGVYITLVVDGAAADIAGLRAANRSDGGFVPAGGDVITAIDGVELGSIQELARIIDLHDVGDEITLSILRNGDRLEIVAKLLEWASG